MRSVGRGHRRQEQRRCGTQLTTGSERVGGEEKKKGLSKQKTSQEPGVRLLRAAHLGQERAGERQRWEGRENWERLLPTRTPSAQFSLPVLLTGSPSPATACLAPISKQHHLLPSQCTRWQARPDPGGPRNAWSAMGGTSHARRGAQSLGGHGHPSHGSGRKSINWRAGGPVVASPGVDQGGIGMSVSERAERTSGFGHAKSHAMPTSHEPAHPLRPPLPTGGRTTRSDQ